MHENEKGKHSRQQAAEEVGARVGGREAAEMTLELQTLLELPFAPSAPHLKAKVLFPLPNGIFKSETQCSPTESTNVQLRDKWGIKEHIT